MAEITVREFELALKHCYMTRCNCPKCPIHNVQDCFQFITKTAYEIIISQEAQIEKYKSTNISPVRHGHWVAEYDSGYTTPHCSECSGIALTKEETSYDYVYSSYCPHCGAKMDGKERDEND